MNQFMAHFAFRNNLEPILFRIIRVMVFLCLFPIGTQKSIWFWQFARSNRIVNCLMGCNHIWVGLGIQFICVLTSKCVLIIYSVFLLIKFPFSSFSVFCRKSICCFMPIHYCPITFSHFVMAQFTVGKMAIFYARLFVEFRHWFRLLALCAGLRYDTLGPDRFSYKRLCLEPVVVRPIIGSTYSIQFPYYIKEIINAY